MIVPNDNWSCGYRNSQMVLSTLSSLSAFDDAMSILDLNIHELQQCLENAWADGFDQVFYTTNFVLYFLGWCKSGISLIYKIIYTIVESSYCWN